MKYKGLPSYSGKSPKTIISAIIYIVAKLKGNKLTQREIANELCVTEITIRRRYKEIVKELELR